MTWGRSCSNGLVLAGLLLVILPGCGGGVSEDVSIADLQDRAAGMTIPQLRQQARAYRDAILVRRRQMADLRARISRMDPASARSMAEESARLSDSVSRLMDCFDVLLNQLDKRRQNIDDLRFK